MIPSIISSISHLSEAGLQERVDNRQNYMPDSVEAAVAELQKRGVEFSPDELQVIREDIQAQRDNVKLPPGGPSLFNKQYKNNIVTDPFAPELYSRLALYAFTFFLGALFGSIMLAINAGKLKNKAGTGWAILFGVLFTAVQIFFTQYANPGGRSTGFIFGLVAALCMDYILWPRIVGNETFYRAKPIYVPLAIAITLGVLIVLAVIFGH